MTNAALTSNKEWNTKIVFTGHAEVAKELISEFEQFWKSEYELDLIRQWKCKKKSRLKGVTEVGHVSGSTFLADVT